MSRSGAHGVDRVLGKIVRGDEHDRGHILARANPRLDLEAAPVREPCIEHHDVERTTLEGGERCALGPRVLDPAGQTFESLAHEERMRGVVLDEKDSR